MEGGRFGMGLAAALLFALAIVAVSGVVAPTAAPVSSTLSSGTSSPRTATTSTVNSGAVFGVSTSETTLVVPSVGNLTSSSGETVNAGSNGQSSGTAAFTSSLAGIGQLSSLSRALLLAPIAVAVLLGALLYRLSGRSRKEQDQP